MSRLKFWKKRSIYEKIPEPESLNANPLFKETQLAVLIAAPLLAFLFGIMIYAKNFLMTQEEFATFTLTGLVCWMMMLAGIYAYQIMRAAKYRLFDREFGYTERLHPRDEIYCKPEDIRLLIGPEDKIEDFEQLEKKITDLGFAADVKKNIIHKLKENKDPKKYLYYFRHKDVFEGWNAEQHVMPTFQSHAVFTDKPFSEQFEFAAGQENWFGPILYNHPSAESDNVRVIAWALDPFTSEPMPIGVLIHSSRRYRHNHEDLDDQQFELLEAQQMLITHLHGLNENYRKETANLTTLRDAKLHDVKDISKHGHKIAEVDQRLFGDIMEPVSRKWLHSTWFKAAVSIVSIIAIVVIIAYVLHWIDLGAIFGGG
jgi:hypothetical protein